MQNIENITDEIIRRMQMLHLHQNVIEEFKSGQQINRSESRYGSLYWLTDEEKILVDTFEKENQDTKVYHLIKTFSKYLGIVYDLLYISTDQNNWDLERENLKENYALSYTITNFPECGYIRIKSVNGGLVRLY